MTVSVSIQIPNFIAMSNKAFADLPLIIAASVQTQRGFIFDHEGEYNGHEKWAPLKFRDGQILSDTGKLRKSIAPMQKKDGKPGREEGTILEARGDMVTVGTDIAYAEIHELGRIYHGTPGMPLAFEVPYKVTGKNGKKRKKGSYWIFCQKIVIPPRPFGTTTQQDAEEIGETVANFYKSLL